MKKEKKPDHVKRREALLRNSPANCPHCFFSDSFELTDWFGRIARWRCNSCKKRFSYEPFIIEDNEDE